jgi:tRNA G37 N-methylase Trm5
VISDGLNPTTSLIRLAHDLIAAKVKPGEIVIDATVGNGHDTAFLLDLIKPNGHVFGFDIQQAAIDQASRNLQANLSHDCLTLIHADHAAMRDYIPSVYDGHVSAVMFNLGYLPGSDKQVKTQSETTLAAIDSACRLISLDGIITILAYPGHEGGEDETDQVNAWCQRLDTRKYQTALFENHPDNPLAPKLFSMTKIG